MGFFDQFTHEQIKEGYAKNADSLEQMAEKAKTTGRKVNGYTEAELRQSAAEYRRRAITGELPRGRS